jgi:hypothetical protein
MITFYDYEKTNDVAKSIVERITSLHPDIHALALFWDCAAILEEYERTEKPDYIDFDFAIQKIWELSNDNRE